MRNAKLLLLTAILAGVPGVSQIGFAQMDPTGEWAPQFDEDFLERIPGPDIGDYLGLPINNAARLRGDSWDASLLTLPENQCRPHPSDYAWRGPANLRIWKEIDRDTQKLIAYHTHISWQAPERTIWMDGRPHPPAEAAHTWQGFSTGKWDGDVLTITTTHLKEGWIRRNGIPRSENATVTEHLFRHGDRLTVMVIVNDPDYLTEPFVRTTDFLYDARQEIAPYPCEAVVEIPRPRGTVPNHLPGDNKFLAEFANREKLPFAATRGGAETMYPEYRLTMKTAPTDVAAIVASTDAPPPAEQNAIRPAAENDGEVHTQHGAGQCLHAFGRRREHRGAGGQGRRAGGGHGFTEHDRQGGGGDPEVVRWTHPVCDQHACACWITPAATRRSREWAPPSWAGTSRATSPMRVRAPR